MIIAIAIIFVIVVAGYSVTRFELKRSHSSFLNISQVSLVNSGINFEAIDWPVNLLGVGFSNSSFDQPFLNLMSQLGVKTLAIETDPVFFQTYQERFASIISNAREIGFKIHIINQLGYPSWYNLLGLKYPLASDPSFTTFETFEINAIQTYAQYKPDYLSLIAEPGLMQQKINASYSLSQWTNLVSTMAQTAKSISPNTETWIDLVPQSSFDMQLLANLVNVPQLNGIGLDLYGNVSPFSITNNAAKNIISHGKMGGLTETWAFSLYSAPSTDVPSNVPAEANWLSTSGIVQWAFQNNFTSIFNPFFSNMYTSTDPLPHFTAPGLKSAAETYYNQLHSGQTTQVFQSYKNLIMTAG